MSKKRTHSNSDFEGKEHEMHDVVPTRSEVYVCKLKEKRMSLKFALTTLWCHISGP